MAWVALDDDDRAFIAEIAKLDDRGAAITAGAYLERKLEFAIKSSLRRDADIENRLFKGYGPLATFAAKVDLAILMGLIPRFDHKQLLTIKDIRNEFAHNPLPTTFQSQRIAGLCGNLIPLTSTAAPENSDIPDELRRSFNRTPSDNRDRYLLKVQYLAFVVLVPVIADSGRLRKKFNALIDRTWRAALREKPQPQPPHRKKNAGHGRGRRRRRPAPSPE